MFMMHTPDEHWDGKAAKEVAVVYVFSQHGETDGNNLITSGLTVSSAIPETASFRVQ
jgi:hypothetical protein